MPASPIADGKAGPQFTDAELGVIFALVRREAIAKGYGKVWHSDNAPLWPHRLRRLRGIARKIHAMRGHDNGI